MDLYELYHDALIRNYIDFCENYLELEKTVTLPDFFFLPEFFEVKT